MKKLFANYSRWFRGLAYLTGPVTTIEIISFFMSLGDLIQLGCAFFYIIFFATFLIESLSHGIHYLKTK
ncbi:hypothetical protein DIS17_10480 [Levilactobacillus brevis]|uniref:Uncharacterized protein n=2 Tax=Levilactobacillus brevis TaxID=1580 RepID=A0AAJ5FHF8_LEVBR|nr:hypothetical protein [Levilactobacillus brevis]AWP45545.1 hypothetical protein CCS05_00700 [Levilactobacillus brevis]RAY09269.1 hypothetical protein DN391_07065 [Levilactobacillus brevis]TOZ02657.1 hypothetical protein DIS17_10480 [Levilactobacillus brevis]